MSLPVLKHTTLAAFDPASPLLPIESFRAFGHDYIGMQTLFPADEEAWDSDNFGRWQGPAPLHSNVLLSIAGAEYKRVGHDDIARVSGALTATAQISERTRVDEMSVRFVLQNAATGAVISNQLIGVPLKIETVVASFSALSTGQSAILWTRVEQAVAHWELPPDYYSSTGYVNYAGIPQDYKYRVEGVEYVWDWLRDVGLRPADTGQLSNSGLLMYAERQKLILGNAVQDRGDWTTYVRAGDAQDCDWAALRIVEGAGEWTASAITPYPGAALLKTSGASQVPVLFDPLARSVSAFDYDGDHIVLSGSIASRTGPLLALWRMASDETATLLGTNPNTTNDTCEFALLSNFASDVLLTKSGQRQVLSLGGLHYYDDTKSIPEALPGTPLNTDGHPGGRCLRQHPATDQVLFLTENFDKSGDNFYNRLQEQTAGRRTTGPGTVFHGHNCAEIAWGQYFGIHQDKPFDDETAQQNLSYLQNGQWIDGGIASFPAAAYRWQRLRSVGTVDGLKLLVCGKAAVGEDAIWGVSSGMADKFKESSLNFRPRRLTRVKADDGNEQIYAVGRFVTDGLLDTHWSVISITSNYITVCLFFDTENNYFEVLKSTLTAAGFDLSKLPAYLWWDVDTEQNAGGVWLQKDAAPEDDTPYLSLSTNTTTVRYTPNSTLPYDGATWARICFTLYDDGGTGTDAIVPEPGCDSAECVFPKMPDGTLPLFLSKDVSTVWSAAQLSDVSDIDETSRLRLLDLQTLSWPILWWRVDSDAELDDLSSYTHALKFNRFQALPIEAKSRIDVCVLVPPGIGRIRVPVLDKWN